MADNPLNLEKMLRGSQNLDVWDAATNGDENTDWTNLVGDKGPSLKKAIKTIMQKAPINSTPFATKAALIADTTLADGAFAFVYNDTDDSNGLYQKDSGVWQYQKWNVLAQAKEYARQVSNYQQIIEYSGVKNTGGKLAVDYAPSLLYVKIAVAENDKYFVPTQNYAAYKGWYITDASNNVLAEAGDFREASESIATAPANSAYLYVNYPLSLKASFKAQKLSDADIIALQASGIYPKQMGVAYVTDTSTPPKAAKVWSDAVKTYIVDVKHGEKYLVDAKAIGTVKSYYFVQPDMTIVASDNNEPTLKILTVPNSATKLIVCSDSPPHRRLRNSPM